MNLKATAAFWSDSNDFVSINMRRRRKQERGSLRLILVTCPPFFSLTV